MTEYPRMMMLTPGKKPFTVRVINPNHSVGSQKGKPQTVPLLDESGIDFLAYMIKERVNHKRDCPVLWTGDRGVGKSTGILKTALAIDPNFNVDKIAFRLDEFNQIFDKNPPGDGLTQTYPQVVLDEAGHALFAQEWMNRAQRTVAKQLIISRIKRQIIWLAVPRRMQLNSQLRDMPYIWVHSSEPDDYLQGYVEVHLAPGGPQSKWFSERYWQPKYAFVCGALSGELWNRYEEKKIIFVNEVTADSASGKGNDQLSDAFDNLVSYNVKTLKQSLHDIEKIVKTMTNQALSKRLKKKNLL